MCLLFFMSFSLLMDHRLLDSTENEYLI